MIFTVNRLSQPKSIAERGRRKTSEFGEAWNDPERRKSSTAGGTSAALKRPGERRGIPPPESRMDKTYSGFRDAANDVNKRRGSMKRSDFQTREDVEITPYWNKTGGGAPPPPPKSKSSPSHPPPRPRRKSDETRRDSAEPRVIMPSGAGVDVVISVAPQQEDSGNVLADHLRSKLGLSVLVLVGDGPIDRGTHTALKSCSHFVAVSQNLASFLFSSVLYRFYCY